MTEQMLTKKQASEILGISKSTLDRWVQQGKITAFKLSEKSVRFKYSELINYINQHKC